MPDFDWKEMPEQKGREAIRQMRRLPISCQHYYYFGGVQPHPLIKFDSVRKRFYSNEYYREK